MIATRPAPKPRSLQRKSAAWTSSSTKPSAISATKGSISRRIRITTWASARTSPIPTPAATKSPRAPWIWGTFKTPTLRDVARTAPYMQDGSLKTLDEVVEFYDKGGKPNKNLDE